jgi:hypothetical protein
MENLKTLIDQLTAAGITSKVNIVVRPETIDIEAVKAERAKLLAMGIIPEVHINLGLGDAAEPGTPPVVPTEKRLTVMVNDDKLNCFTFKKRNDAGRPIFIIREPRIQLFRGERFQVSAERTESSKDVGDGIIIGDGGLQMYFIADCPPKPEAVGFYVKLSEVVTVV